MEVLANPGLLHILEKIYLNLDSESLDNCALLSKSLALPLKDPRFWHKKCLLKGQEIVETWKSLFQSINENELARDESSLVLKTLYIGKKDIFSNGVSPFVAARGLYHIIQPLISNGANINAKNLIVFAIKECKNVAIIEDLIKHGADVNLKLKSKSTLLHIAVKNKQTKVVKLLLQNGAKANARDGYDSTPLWYAILHNLDDIVKLLISHGADTNILMEILCCILQWIIEKLALSKRL